MIQVLCQYDPPHTHTYPLDWHFGGPRGTDPRADPRWKPRHYVYLDSQLREVWTTHVPRCLDQALDEFSLYRGYDPKYLEAQDESGVLQLVPFEYDPVSDSVFSL